MRYKFWSVLVVLQISSVIPALADDQAAQSAAANQVFSEPLSLRELRDSGLPIMRPAFEKKPTQQDYSKSDAEWHAYLKNAGYQVDSNGKLQLYRGLFTNATTDYGLPFRQCPLANEEQRQGDFGPNDEQQQTAVCPTSTAASNEHWEMPDGFGGWAAF
jgi:hypothetical protein